MNLIPSHLDMHPEWNLRSCHFTDSTQREFSSGFQEVLGFAKAAEKEVAVTEIDEDVMA